MARFLGVLVLLLSTGFNAMAQSVPPKAEQHLKVYSEAGRYGGWPANHGIWSWDNEILVGYSRGYYKARRGHHFDPEKHEEHWLARSLDGGETWSLEHPTEKGQLIPRGDSLHGIEKPGLAIPPLKACPGGIDFTHPDFALTLRMDNANAGTSRFNYSYDRGKNWEGPFEFPDFDSPGTAARTDYIVNGKSDCTAFMTVAKVNGREGRVICIRTRDGGKTWTKEGEVGPEVDDGFSIMPSTVKLDDGTLLTATRRRDKNHRWNDLYQSRDEGKNWFELAIPVQDTGSGNPPSMLKLQDGRLCIIYGFRAEPYSLRCVFSNNNGKTWTEPHTLRDDGLTGDMGYVRSVQRPDGKIVSVYYFTDATTDPDRYIAATIWDPGKR